MKNQNENVNKGVFLNGRKQVIELLRLLPQKERAKLINNMTARNPGLARELGEQALSFLDIMELNDYQLERIFNMIEPNVVGLSLYFCHVSVQRRILSVMEKDKAQKAYELISQNLGDKKALCEKAQDKVLNVFIELKRRNSL